MRPAESDAVMPGVIRLMVALMVVALVAVFATAAWLRPYDANGDPRTMATHTQLGLPPCSMVALTGKPCPACGMTTAFSLLVHGDVAAALHANWAGVLLALFWLALIPWGAISVVRRTWWRVRQPDLALTVAIGVLFTLMLVRWAIVLLT
jgi:hypothetical protein